MGQWNITIRGTGSHHNRGADGKPSYPKDADRIASKVVRELREAGHTITSATITCGSEQDLIVSPSAEPDADPET